MVKYEDFCTGIPEVAFSRLDTTGQGAVIFRGDAYAQRFKADFECLDFVTFRILRYANQSFHLEIREDVNGLPKGAPLTSEGRLVDNFFPYTMLPTTEDWVHLSIGAVLTKGKYYWICIVPSDFYDTPIYRVPGYERFFVRASYFLEDYYDSIYMGYWRVLWDTTLFTAAFALYKLTYMPSITAEVIDGVMPIKDVEIRIADKSCITDDKGVCTITGLTKNTNYTISASKTGYKCISGCGTFNTGDAGGIIYIEMRLTGCLETFMPDRSIIYLEKTQILNLTGKVVNLDNLANKEIGIIFHLPDGSTQIRSIGILSPCEAKKYSFEFANIPEKIYGKWFLEQVEKVNDEWKTTEIAFIQVQEPFPLKVEFKMPGPNYLNIGLFSLIIGGITYGLYRLYRG